MRRHHILLITLTILVTTAAASAYVLNGPRWGVKEIPYYINPVNQHMSQADAIAAIRAGAMNWSAQSNADVAFYYMGQTTGSSLARNNKNEVFFRNTSAGSMAAEAYWWYDSSYKLVEADIVFYEGGFKFFPGSSGCSNGLYLEDIATHEFGHAIGLGHSNVSSATMYPSIKYCSTALRSLDPDDLAGVEKLYPRTTSNTAPSVTISSPANGASVNQGTSMTFSGSATDKEDGTLSGQLKWMSSRDGQIGTGASFTRTLSAGTHTITATVYDSHGALGSRSVSVTVNATVTNTAPSVTINSPATGASFAEGTSITFSGSATDTQDGTISSKLVWTSSLDGQIGTGASFTRTLRAGTHTIVASATDSGGLTGSRSVSVTVTAATTTVKLSGRGYKNKGAQYADLTWSGATTSSVEVYRDGVRVAVPKNTGAYTDSPPGKGGGSATYTVCEAGTSKCSSPVAVKF